MLIHRYIDVLVNVDQSEYQCLHLISYDLMLQQQSHSSQEKAHYLRNEVKKLCIKIKMYILLR